MAACRKEAPAPGRPGIFQEDRIDRRLFNLCMERKGYTATVEK
jgi:hypothetical protein